MEPSVSVIMPALNEEGNLPGAVESVLATLAERGADFEILLFNDGSTDGTGTVAEGLARAYPQVRVIHNPRPRGLGYNYRKGVEGARFKYVIMVPGDNEVPESSLRTLADHLGRADVLIPYFVNPWVRPLPRRFISRTFVMLMNLLFGLRLRYYNGPCVIRRELLRSVPMRTDGFVYMADILVRLIGRGCRYRQVALSLGERSFGRSKAFTLKNILSVFRTVASLFWEIRIQRRKNSEGEGVAASSGWAGEIGRDP